MAERASTRVMRVARVRPEGEAGVTLVLDGALAAEPGQFVMALAARRGRAALHASWTTTRSALTVARRGAASPRLSAPCEPGDRLWVRGPFGHGFALQGERHLLVGGRQRRGVADPAGPAARRAGRRGDRHRARRAHRSATDASPGVLTSSAARRSSPPTTARAGLHGTALDAVADLLAAGWPDAVYACGPEPMLRALARERPGACAPLLGQPGARDEVRPGRVRQLPLRRPPGLPRRPRVQRRDTTGGDPVARR